MVDIFISCSNKDAQLTQGLARALESEGYTTWWDRDFAANDNFIDQIRRQLEEAKAVIAIWSNWSVTSKWVHAEASYAYKLNKLLTVCDPSFDLHRVPLPFNSLNTISIANRKKILKALISYGVTPSRHRCTNTNVVALSKKGRIAKAIVDYDGENFRELIELGGLDPSKHLRFWDWSYLNFESADLRGYDFTGALLRNCRFQGARISGARFDKANLAGANLRDALDWREYVNNWIPDTDAPTDEHLKVGAVFQDAPFAPEMVVVPPGRFWMGSKEGEGDDDERPQHEVTIPQAIAVGRYPVTLHEWAFAEDDAEWVKATGRKPRAVRAEGWQDGRPVIDVSWEDAREYVTWLSHKTGQPYRLLSEAEWEYACRAGSEAAYCFGDDEAELGVNAWYDANSKGETHPVGGKKPNRFGLYDMHGNVWEWCEDAWHERYAYKPGELKETGGAWTTGDVGGRVLRGGSWVSSPENLRAAARVRDGTGFRHSDRGFRVARTILTP
jgi:formylglycine-generating enzyme required for sulfatase activity